MSVLIMSMLHMFPEDQANIDWTRDFALNKNEPAFCPNNLDHEVLVNHYWQDLGFTPHLKDDTSESLKAPDSQQKQWFQQFNLIKYSKHKETIYGETFHRIVFILI